MVTDFDTRHALHWTLLRLAGRLPDGLITTTRRLLAHGWYAQTARITALAVVGRRIAPHEEDLRCLRAILAGGGPALGTPLFGDPMPHHTFSAAPPCPHARRDHLDRAAVAGAHAEPAVNGVWRSWRTPPGGAHHRTARPVFVVEVDAGADAPGIAARLQDRLIKAGDLYPQAEVYEVGDWLPAYQRMARAEGELLWARAPDPVIRIAPPALGLTGVGPERPEDTQRVEDDDERARLMAYLEAGSPVLITTARMCDVVEPDRGRSVPMSFRTDGFWIWNDISSYYLRVYGFRPDAELVAHIETNGYRPPPVDGVAEFRAISALYRAEEEDDEDATAADHCY